ncbi:TetR family transcriptional regulator [Streptomyces venezuelae]|uniref:TetR family transcriptional regulator n=1 Tax=Streptomyces venezuelae TaxID=54571 RepID=A0A5P2CW93_STRVZ|nr:TetR family transcriptional regulator C-terminal domain-containing protein [Streptomyces venezuelae]QES45129.1 TetR family transcriptional regulator [Streptomyces venezuelae]
MSSSVQRKRIRKSPAARRAEIVEKAADIALSEGLECITLRRIGEELDVRPGLVSHYFPSTEELVAEAFGSAATGELDALLPPAEPGSGTATATERLAAFFARTSGPAWNDISRLWINARHLTRYRPSLRDRVARQEDAWRGRLAALVEDGVARGEFRTQEDASVVAVQILVVLDGLGADGGADADTLPPAVARMAVTWAERELGLERGALGPDPYPYP